MKKNYILIFILFLILPWNSNVWAASSKCGENHYGVVNPKKICIDGNCKHAYCADSRPRVKCSSKNSAYSLSSGWKSSKACEYGSAKNLDCSIMTGFVIKMARKALKDVGVDIKKPRGYIFIQRAVQTYLYNHSRGWEGKNEDYSNYRAGDENNGKKISTVIKDAYDGYSGYQNATNNFPTPSLGIDVGVDKGDWDMYYMPSQKAYYSYKITVKINGLEDFNLNNLKIYVNTSDSNIRVCSGAGDNACSLTTALESGSTAGHSTYDFYLVTSKSNIENPSFTVTAEYKASNAGGKITYYDTSMYKTGKSEYQKLLVYDTESDPIPAKFVYATKTMPLTIVPVNVSDCSNLYSGFSTSVGNSNAVDKVCKNNNKVTISDDEADRYTAKFNACKVNDVHTIKFYYNNGSNCVEKTATTSIAVGQQGVFTFGGVSGDTKPNIVKGQGFYLLGNNTYEVGVSWKKAIVYHNTNNAYFYLPNNEIVHHNDIVYEDEASCKAGTGGKPFDEYANNSISTLSLVKTDKNFSEIFTTYVNDDTEEKNVPAIVDVTTNETDIENLEENTIGTITYRFSTPDAFFNKKNDEVVYDDGGMKYSADDYIKAGKRYYTLLKYNRETYPLNISETDLSLVDGINWKFKADCDIPVGEGCPEIYTPDGGKYSLNVSYRPISVSDPFPKGKVPKNWVDTNNSKSQMNRIASTFSKEPYYSINLDNVAINKVNNNYNSNYAYFDNVNINGTSRFINEMGFNTKNTNSYCSLGEFNSECDSYR